MKQNLKPQGKIGIFDSGFGGLTVMREYLQYFPEYDYIYLGDQANNPYGSRSAERVNDLTERNVKFLIEQGCELIIVACNTASADALRHVQQIYKGSPVILGVIIPAVEEALRQTRFGRVGVMATQGTVKSKAYARELVKYASVLYQPKDKRAETQVRLTEKACPLLVPLVEEGMTRHVVTRMMLRSYLRPLKHANIDTLILGCTHYPLLYKEIDRIIGKRVKVISSSLAAVEAMGNYFERHPNLKEKLTQGGTRTYYTTDCPDRFAELGSRFLGQKLEAEKIEI